ncbi:hypothetical protein CBF23_006550 [Marinomonas agarivorans]|nr:hypothetical protein CBF23_006550 [Marinomonas agarivorans]
MMSERNMMVLFTVSAYFKKSAHSKTLAQSRTFSDSPMSRRGFISLPVVLLLLFMIGVSYGVYQALADERQWRYQQQIALADQAIWSAFTMDIATQTQTLRGIQAAISRCQGFCDVHSSNTDTNTNSWPYRYVMTGSQNEKEETLRWQFVSMSPTEPYYRLCAQRNVPREVRCWWYQQRYSQLVVQGYMPFLIDIAKSLRQ